MSGSRIISDEEDGKNGDVKNAPALRFKINQCLTTRQVTNATPFGCRLVMFGTNNK
jgi:hypothetical protein